MKTSVMKKSLLDYAIKGFLSTKFRKDNPTLNALDEIEAYNVQILKDKQAKEKELKNLESTLKKEKDKETKQNLKSRISILKKEIAKIKIITPLDSPSAIKIAPPNEETNLNNQIGGATSVAQRDTFTPPFEIPPSWVWVKLGEICEMNPKNQIDDELEVSFIPMTLIADGFQNKFSYESKKWKEVKNNFTHLCENSVAFAKITPCFQNGKAVILKNLVNGYGAGTTELIVLLPSNALLKKYLFYCINSPAFVDNGIKNFKGTAGQQRISTEFVQNFPIPLPPLAEQKQIVKILDQLMDLANEFERTQENLKRIEKRIEKSLLKFAIEGNLSKCYRKDNPTLNALDEIEAYNASILKDKKAKEKALKTLESSLKNERDKEAKQNLKAQITALKKEITKLKIITPLTCHSEALAEESQRDISHFTNAQHDKDTFTPPFAIPESWVWVRLGEVCEMNPKNQINDELEVSFIPMTLIADNFQNKFDYEIKKWKEVKSGFTHLCENSVAFAKITPCFQNGKAAILKNLKNGYGAGTTELIILLPNKALLKEYLFYCINSPIFVDNGIKNFKGTAGQQRINTEFVQRFPIPLPPLEEQKEIVKVLDSLFTLAKGLRVE